MMVPGSISVNFFVCTWEEYHTEILEFPLINGIGWNRQGEPDKRAPVGIPPGVRSQCVAAFSVS